MRKRYFIWLCSREGIPASSAELIWQAWSPHQFTPWFMKHCGHTILKANKNQLLLTMIPLDYLNGDGMALLFAQLERYLPAKGVRLRLAEFCRHFYDMILKPHGQKVGTEWQTMYDADHYDVLRKLFIRNLVAFVCHETRLPHMETELLAKFSSYYNATHPQP